MQKITGRAYVLGDNVDTDQIIPAEYLSYDPSIPEERKLFGRHALSGVPPAQAGLPDGRRPFIAPNAPADPPGQYAIVVAGKNFGCGSSREHAPLALAEAGVKAVVAQFYARIFFRNSVNGAYLVPLESQTRLVDEIRTGDQLEIDPEAGALNDLTTGKTYRLKPLGDAAAIIEAGGIFEYAHRRETP